jgi:DNA polymerase/3'-5' exonuclease PolX
MTQNEKASLDAMYQQTLVSVQRHRDRVADIQFKMTDEDNSSTDIAKYATAMNNCTKSIENEIRTLKNLATVIEALDSE